MKIGDSVSVVDDQVKGKITAIKGNKIIIKDEHGFEYDYSKEEIVLQEANIYENIKMVTKPETSKTVSKKHDKKPFVLDLHFELLVKNPLEFDSFERLFLQKEKLLQTIDYCQKTISKNSKSSTVLAMVFCSKWFTMFWKAKRI